MIVEIDGPIHDQYEEADRERQRAIEARGYRFLRVSAYEVEDNLPAIIRDIEVAVAGDLSR
jgi:very-short-patch-repair endonuclease